MFAGPGPLVGGLYLYGTGSRRADGTPQATAVDTGVQQHSMTGGDTHGRMVRVGRS